IYSTFLQRGYDQVWQEVVVQGLPVVFAMDRAGIVGGDGVTHQGLFDVAFLRTLPGVVLMAPADPVELDAMLEHALSLPRPSAVLEHLASLPEPAGAVVRVRGVPDRLVPHGERADWLLRFGLTPEALCGYALREREAAGAHRR